jgi:hypothetical protein
MLGRLNAQTCVLDYFRARSWERGDLFILESD